MSSIFFNSINTIDAPLTKAFCEYISNSPDFSATFVDKPAPRHQLGFNYPFSPGNTVDHCCQRGKRLKYRGPSDNARICWKCLIIVGKLVWSFRPSWYFRWTAPSWRCTSVAIYANALVWRAPTLACIKLEWRIAAGALFTFIMMVQGSVFAAESSCELVHLKNTSWMEAFSQCTGYEWRKKLDEMLAESSAEALKCDPKGRTVVFAVRSWSDGYCENPLACGSCLVLNRD